MIIKNILFKFIDLNSSQYINNVSFQCTTQFKKKKVQEEIICVLKRKLRIRHSIHVWYIERYIIITYTKFITYYL